MKLLLTSSGLRNESQREALRGMLGKSVSECNMLFIPTSYHPVVRDMTWFVDDIYNAHQMGWKQFAILDIATKDSWDRELWWPMIEEADVIMMGGGNAAYLSYWLEKTGLFDALPELLKTKVYVGISAGSMMLTAGVLSNEVGQTDDPSDWGVKPGGAAGKMPEEQRLDKTLGLTDFMFRPHWGKNDPKYTNLNEAAVRRAYAYFHKPIYLVDDQTAIKIVDDEVEVVSEGQWVLVDHE